MKKEIKFYIVISLILIIVLRKIVLSLKYARINKLYGDTINKLHPSCDRLFKEFLYRMDKQGYQIIITSSYRSFTKQQQLKSENPQNASAGLSFHNYGMALDINLKKGEQYWKKSDSIEHWKKTNIDKVCNDLKLRWGGTFSSYHDPIHIDVDGRFNTKELLTLAHKQYGTNVNDIVGNKVRISLKMAIKKFKIDRKVGILF